MSNLRGPKRRDAILRLRLKYGTDQTFGDPKVLFRILHLTEVWRDGYSLHPSHSDLSGSQIQCESGIAFRIARQSSQVVQGRLNDQLPGLRTPRQLPNLHIDVEQLIRQLTHFIKSPFRNGAGVIRQTDSHGESDDSDGGCGGRQPIPAQKPSSAIPCVAGAGMDRPPFQEGADVVRERFNVGVSLSGFVAEGFTQNVLNVTRNGRIALPARRSRFRGSQP